MVQWIITFLVLAIIAAFFGFTGLSGAFASAAQFLTGLFVLLFVATLLYSLFSGHRPPRVQ